MKRVQDEMKKLEDEMAPLRTRYSTLDARQRAKLEELRRICDLLGMTWAEGCPSFRKTQIESHCIIKDWHDKTGSTRMCINCQISVNEARIKTVLCKLKGDTNYKE